MGGHGDGPGKLSVTGYIIRTIQYLIGFFLSLCSIFYQFYGLFHGYAEATVEWGLPPGAVFAILCVLITVLAYCEATQVALMIIEKVDSADLGEGWFMGRAKKAHALARANVNTYLIGRQTFVTVIVMFTAYLLHLDHAYTAFCADTLGKFWGHEVFISIFVRTGLCGSLILLAFGQLIPELLVTTNPTFMFRLPPAYEIIWLNQWCERLGLCQFSEVLADVTRWALRLPDDEYAAGSKLRVTAAGETEEAQAGDGDEEKNIEEDPESEQYKIEHSFWPSFFKSKVPTWWLVIKYIVGTSLMAASTFAIVWNVLSGQTAWCPQRILCHAGDTRGACALGGNGFEADGSGKWVAPGTVGEASCFATQADATNQANPIFSVTTQADCATVADRVWTGPTTIYPDCHNHVGTDGIERCVYTNGGVTYPATEHCIMPAWAMFVFIIPLMTLLLMFLEGSQIAVLALEKAPGRHIKRLHRPAYFGHKVSQVRDNVRRYLLGRQFLVVFGDFVATKCMGFYGVGYVLIIEVYPRLVALKNPMYWLGTWGSRFVLLLALAMEFVGFTHFAWGIYKVLNWFIRCACGVEDDSFSVGEKVDMDTGDKEEWLYDETPDGLREIITKYATRIKSLEEQLEGHKAVPAGHDDSPNNLAPAEDVDDDKEFDAEDNTQTADLVQQPSDV